MDKEKQISMQVIRRLPKYRRYLLELDGNEIEKISSSELGKKMGITSSQIRQDFNCFGDFGQQGYGYNVKNLLNTIDNILGVPKSHNVIIVGAGNIGKAIANYSRFEDLGFSLKCIFEINPKLIGMKVRNVQVKDINCIDEYIRENKIDIGCICVEKIRAQEVSNLLVNSGIKAIWNFAPIDLKLPEDVVVENVHLSDSILTLGYLLKQNK